MSGIGEIGLALGIYRFIISGVDDYRRAARTWRRYRDYDKEVERVMTILQTECEIFRNNFKLLLRRVPDSEEEWLSPEVERKLRMKLTTSYFPFRQTSQELNQCLKSLREKLNLNTDVCYFIYMSFQKCAISELRLILSGFLECCWTMAIIC